MIKKKPSKAIKSVAKIGEFGPIYTQFKGKPKEAIRHLKKVKKGECVNALYRSDIGYIDLVWGENNIQNKGFGLKHIIEKHGSEVKQIGFEVEDFIPIVIAYGNVSVKKSDEKKIVFENNMFRFVVITLWDNKSKKFLLTAFDLRKKPKK